LTERAKGLKVSRVQAPGRERSHERYTIHHRRKGRKTAAIVDLRKQRALWEDIEDVLVSPSRRREKRIPLDKVKADLNKSA
jgi:hypothetical protein